MTRSAMLRFTEDEFAERQARTDRRERFSSGQIHVPERNVLAAVLEFLKRHPKVAWAARSNVGSGFLIRRDVYDRLVRGGHLRPTEARFARYGLKNGGDVTGQLRGSGRRLEAECKSDTGKATDEQQAFGDAVNVGGGLWFVARSIDDAARALEAA